MQLRKAERKNAKIKAAITGPSGSGKTYSSLLLASGLTDWKNIAVIDTENGSADLYAHLGNYSVISLKEHKPDKYIEAIEMCEKAGIEVVIIDSITHEWQWCKDYHSSLPGNSFTNWGKVTPLHDKFLKKILNSDVHVIATMRTKQDYILQDKNGKKVPEKVGLKTVQRDGMDYEFTLVFDLDIKHNATVSKDRTNLFEDDIAFVISENTGDRIAEWCKKGTSKIDVIDMIGKAKKLEDLKSIWERYPEFHTDLKEAFGKKRELIEAA